MSKAVLHLGDCLEYMKTLAPASVDCIVTDPPYGIGEDGGLKARYRRGDGRTKGIVKHEYRGWDISRPSKQVFNLFFVLSKKVMIFGGNYFADMLPPSSGWKYWDKKIGGDYSDGELIYTNMNIALRSFTVHPFHELSGGKDRVHPTQKPLSLMRWCINSISKVGDTIFDPFMGSGTTGVAAVQLGRKFIGCEIDQNYFAIAEKRIRQAEQQPALFTVSDKQEQPAVQGELIP